MTPFVIDPTTPTTIYAGYYRLYKSADQGNTWTEASPPLNNFSSLHHIAVAPTSGKTIYVVSWNNIYRTTDGGASWTQVNNNLPGNDISYLSVDPDNENTVYVTLGGYAPNVKVYVSENGGASWTNISGSLPNLPANCVIAQPNSNGVLYLAMDIGIYRRDPIKGQWELFNTGLPNVPVTELEIQRQQGKIRASTYGRGLWESDLAPIVNPCSAPPVLPPANVEPRAATLRWDAQPDAAAYTLQWRKAGDPAWTAVPGLSVLSNDVFFLTPCTNYEYRVRAVCPDGQSIYSNTMPFTTGGCSSYCPSYGNLTAPGSSADRKYRQHYGVRLGLQRF